MSRADDLLRMGRRWLGAEAPPPTQPSPASDRRAGRRVLLGLPVQACVQGGKFHDCKILDANPRGIAVEPAEDATPGQSIALSFTGIPKEVPPFTLFGEIVRVFGDVPHQALGIRVDRRRTTPDAATHYRNFVLYYLRHKPLLEEIGSGYFEARCAMCGWVGRVGRRNPACSNCGGPVESFRAPSE